MDINKAKEFLVKAKKKDRIYSSYIIFGGNRKERKECVVFLSKLLHCKETPPCNKCTSCQQIEKNAHPDTKWIVPSKSILSINDVTWVKDDIYITPYYGGKKIYIFEIDYMRAEAANSFLKVLEEPPSYGTLIIHSSNINFFLPTILSRCQKIRLNYKLPEYTEDMIKIYQQFKDTLHYLRTKNFWGFFKAIDAFVAERDREEMEEDTGKILLLYRDIYLKKTGISDDLLVNKEVDESFLYADKDIFSVMEKILELKGRIRYNINLKLALDYLFLQINR
jgi:DNA polymerase-3 subunit delta'